jgi:hypothetical protein
MKNLKIKDVLMVTMKQDQALHWGLARHRVVNARMPHANLDRSIDDSDESCIAPIQLALFHPHHVECSARDAGVRCTSPLCPSSTGFPMSAHWNRSVLEIRVFSLNLAIKLLNSFFRARRRAGEWWLGWDLH